MSVSQGYSTGGRRPVLMMGKDGGDPSSTWHRAPSAAAPPAERKQDGHTAHARSAQDTWTSRGAGVACRGTRNCQWGRGDRKRAGAG